METLGDGSALKSRALALLRVRTDRFLAEVGSDWVG